jgi:hypothetical protein
MLDFVIFSDSFGRRVAISKSNLLPTTVSCCCPDGTVGIFFLRPRIQCLLLSLHDGTSNTFLHGSFYFPAQILGHLSCGLFIHMAQLFMGQLERHDLLFSFELCTCHIVCTVVCTTRIHGKHHAFLCSDGYIQSKCHAIFFIDIPLKANMRMLVEGASQYKSLAFLERKDDQVDITCQQLQRVKSRGLPLQCIRCDNAGENKNLEKQLVSSQWKLPLQFEYTQETRRNKITKLRLPLQPLPTKQRHYWNLPMNQKNFGTSCSHPLQQQHRRLTIL